MTVEVRRREQLIADAKRQLLEARLQTLTVQIEPHFLMNTLANLRYLIGADPRAASEMLDHLADFLERALDRSRAAHSTVGNTLKFVPVQDVCYCQSDGKYTRVVTAGAEALIRRPLSALLEDLDPELFWRINRGIAVNVHHIDRVVREDGGEMIVRIRASRAELPVSKAHQGRFRGM